jgi:hypothetical protein
MYAKFPGLNNSMLEEKVNDIENSITNSLIDNSEREKRRFYPFYIIGFISIIGVAALITYMCIKMM